MVEIRSGMLTKARKIRSNSFVIEIMNAQKKTCSRAGLYLRRRYVPGYRMKLQSKIRNPILKIKSEFWVSVQRNPDHHASSGSTPDS